METMVQLSVTAYVLLNNLYTIFPLFRDVVDYKMHQWFKKTTFQMPSGQTE